MFDCLTIGEDFMAKVGFIGVGKLGMSCAEMMAESHEVIGYDIVPRSPANFKMVSSIRHAILERDIIFVAVETPHDEKYDGMFPTSHLPTKDFDYSVVSKVLEEINLYVSDSQIVSLISTVLPGTCRSLLLPKINRCHFIYNPYLIAMGTVKWDMVNPELVIIGRSTLDDDVASNKLVDFYSTIMQNNPPYHSGTFEDAESIKVFYNTFISAKVSLVNMIQDVAERLGNMDSSFVCSALSGATRRIMGPAYMVPGMGDGGACHPRDNIALRNLAERLDLGYDLFDAVMRSREVQAKNMAEYLLSLHPHLPVVIMGKAYKPLVPYINGSSSVLVGHYVSAGGRSLYFYDEELGEFPPQNLGPAIFLLSHDPSVTYGDQLDHVAEWYRASHKAAEADRALINSPSGRLFNFPKGSFVVDPWRKTPGIDGVSVIHYGNTRFPRT